MCPAWLHKKCWFFSAYEAKLKMLFEFYSNFELKCKIYQHNKKFKSVNVVTKGDLDLTSAMIRNLKVI